MCAASLWLLIILCVCCTALSGSENNGVVWRDFGGSVTIQCRHSDPDQGSLYLLRGLTEYDQVLIKLKQHDSKLKDEFKKRIQVKGEVPIIDIFITNLTIEDTGVYWCVFKKLTETGTYVQTKGNGSILLVVTGAAQQCDPSTPSAKGTLPNDLLLMSLVISAIVLLSLCVVFIVWIKKKVSHSTKKPRRLPTNDVYEDMRATIRR